MKKGLNVLLAEKTDNQSLNKDVPPRRTFCAESHKKHTAPTRLLMRRYIL